jgi:hypothetical protein
MDELTQAYYELRFTVEFLRSNGDTFQGFFDCIMGFAYPADFIAVRPFGNIGDRKNDGYLKSERTLFQVYAPNELSQAETMAKINADFVGALPHWKAHFDTWVFVHNSTKGLPPDVAKLLLDLEAANKPLTLTQWGLAELTARFRKIKTDDLESLFGAAPSSEGKLALGFDELRLVLENVASFAHHEAGAPKPVPAGKIEANALSANVGTLLRAGMEKAPLVGDFFAKWSDPEYGDRIAETFRAKYLALRASSPPLTGDAMFDTLHMWAAGTAVRTSAQRVAVLAVLAFLFEQCEIFEPART